MVFHLVRDSKKWKSKGTRVKLGRWQSWFKVTADWKGERSSMLLVLMFAGLKRGWFQSLEELPFGQVAPWAAAAAQAFRDDGQPVMAIADEEQAAPIADAGSSQPTSTSSAVVEASSPAAPEQASARALGLPPCAQLPAAMVGGAPSVPAEAPRTVRASNEELRKVRSGCKNTLHFRTLSLGDGFSNQVTDMVDSVCEPANTMFNKGLTMTKSRDGSLAFHLRLCHGGFGQVIADMFQKIVDPPTMARIGFLTQEEAPFCDEAALMQDGYLANLMCTVWMNVSKNMLLSCMGYSHRLPGLFIGILDADDGRRQATLERLRRWFGLLQEADTQAHRDPWVRKFLDSLIWPRMTWVREVMAMMYEVDFTAPTREILTAVEGYANSFLSTRVDEDVFNMCRQREHAQSAETISRAGRYHVAMCSDLLESYGYEPVRVTSRDRGLTSQAPPAEAYQCLDASRCSLSGQEIASISDKAAFPHVSPAANKLAGPAWSCVEKLNGDWGKIKNAWVSLLATPGLMLLDRSSSNRGVATRVGVATLLAGRPPPNMPFLSRAPGAARPPIPLE